MEVHHHPDLHHKKKHWKEYVLEFIMIFLAVTLGFFSENIREHFSDKGKTHEFATLLYQDFTADSLKLVQLIKYTDEKIKNVDSLGYFIHQPHNQTNDSDLYRSVIYLVSTSPFDNITGSYDQIKNTGSLRFFDQVLINNLNSYESSAFTLKQMEEWENKVLYEQVFPKAGEMFNFSVMDDIRNKGIIGHKMYLKNASEDQIDVFINQSIVIKHLRERQLIVQKILLQKASRIVSDLKTEFDME